MWKPRSKLSAFFVATTAVVGMAELSVKAVEPTREVTFAIAIHGGAGAWSNRTADEMESVRAGIEEALRRGRNLLSNGGDSVDAVEKTLRYLEDSPLFNAGKGATFNARGEHELDASIMRGEDMAAGAVAAVSVVKNPISLARRVMTDTKHVLLVGKGADEFAREVRAELVDADYFWTEKTRAEWHAAQTPQNDEQSRHIAQPREVDHYGTVGCVALDQRGNLAAGTSTGGLKLKRVGRVGDSAIIGAGTYADNRACAISCTGVGELFMRHAVAYDVAARVRYQQATLKEAVRIQVEKRLPAGTGGLIALGPTGEVVSAFNTAAMPRGMADSSGRFEVSFEQEQ